MTFTEGIHFQLVYFQEVHGIYSGGESNAARKHCTTEFRQNYQV